VLGGINNCPALFEQKGLKIMDRLAQIAQRVAAGDVFTIKKPIKFKPEGSTMNAVFNARLIHDAGYEFAAGTVHYEDQFGGIQSIDVFFRRGDELVSHTFKGFNCGYGGEGPHGLVEFSELFGIGLSKNKIMDHDYRASLSPKASFDLQQMF